MLETLDFGSLADPVSRALLGEPNRSLSKRGELRFGANGSMKVVTEGKAAGTFADFENGLQGGLLDLITAQRGGDHRDAMRWIEESGFAAPTATKPSHNQRVSAIYPYMDENGTKLFEVVRLENPKTFRQRRNENDWSVKGCKVVPYRLPALQDAIRRQETIFIVEGEKDVDRLAEIGLTATTNAGGAGKWRLEHSMYLAGADVVIIPDNDEAGADHAEKVARSLKGQATRIRTLNLPDMPEKGDVSDWLDSGNKTEQLKALLDDAPEWRKKSRLRMTYFGQEDNFPARNWLVKGVFGQNELSVIYAPSGGGKSFFALDLAARVASGLEWFTHRVTRSGVLYVCGEGASGFRNRMKAWRQASEIEPSAFGMLPFSLDFMSDIRTTETLQTIREAMDEIEEGSGQSVRLIVLDTASRMMPGGVDSDPKDMKAFLDNVEALRVETGAHICVIHHSGKDKDRGMRGSSMLRDYADTVIEITPGEEGPSVAKIDKMKDGIDGTNYRFTLQVSSVGLDEDGEEITSCFIEANGKGPGNETAKSKRLPDNVEVAKRTLVDLLNEASVTGRDGRHVTVEQWREACRKKDLIEAGEKGRQQWKRLKDKALRLCVVVIEEGYVWPA